MQANLELSLFDEATNAAKSGLQLDPDNSELQKQMRLIKAKKAAKASADRNQSLGRPVRDGDAKEILELQDQMQATRRGECCVCRVRAVGRETTIHKGRVGR